MYLTFYARFANYKCFRRGEMEKSSVIRDLPVPKAVYSFLRDNVSSSFHFPGWNKGRVVCQRSQLKKLQSSLLDSSGDETEPSNNFIALTNLDFPLAGTRRHTAELNDRIESDNESFDSEKETEAEAELLALWKQWMARWSQIFTYWYWTWTIEHKHSEVNFSRRFTNYL